MITKKMLKEIDTLHGDIARVVIFSDGSGYIDSEDVLVFEFDTLEELKTHLTPRALDKCQHCNGAGVLMTAIGSKLCPRCEGSGTCQ